MSQIPTLYKYMVEEYAQRMLHEGSVRLGTLYEYRNHWNDQIKDVDEGKFTERQFIEKGNFSGNNIPGPLGKIISMPNGGTLSVTDFTNSNRFQVPNCNIYCTTLVASKEVMKSFDSDICVEIFRE